MNRTFVWFVRMVVWLGVGMGVAGAAERLTWGKVGSPESAVALTVASTHVICEVSLRSEEEDALAKWNGVEEGRVALGVIARKSGLEVRAERLPELGGAYGKSGFSSSVGDQEPVYPLLLLVPLKPGTNVVHAVRQIRNVLGQFKTAKKMRVTVGSPQLACENAEIYREELLRRISLHIQRTSALLGFKNQPLVSGLEGPILARLKEDEQLELYLPFRATYEPEGRRP